MTRYAYIVFLSLISSFCSFSFAQSTGSISTGSQTGQANQTNQIIQTNTGSQTNSLSLLQSQFFALSQELSGVVMTGNYNDMLSVLQCMDIPVPNNDATYREIYV